MCGTTVHSRRCGWHGAGWHGAGWHGAGWHGQGWRFNQITEQNQTDDAPADALEVPSAEQEASPAPAQEGWDNDTSLHASLQQWGVGFCRVHHVGSFCNHFTRVKCCRFGWGYGMCGTTVHSRRCGWHGAGWHGAGWHGAGWHGQGWRFNQITEQNPTEDASADEPADVFPDETTGFDSLGPFEDVPSPEQEANPAPAKIGWENETGLQAAAFNTWGRSFCTAHRVGTFCDSYTQVSCCRTSWGFEKCGSTAHSSRCGWRGGVVSGGGSPWHIHQGWRPSSFCRVHHVGFFCYGHRKVHCCNDYGHFVDCTTRSESSWRC